MQFCFVSLLCVYFEQEWTNIIHKQLICEYAEEKRKRAKPVCWITRRHHNNSSDKKKAKERAAQAGKQWELAAPQGNYLHIPGPPVVFTTNISF